MHRKTNYFLRYKASCLRGKPSGPEHQKELKKYSEELLRRGLGRVGVVEKVEAEKLLKEYTACSLERFHRYGIKD